MANIVEYKKPLAKHEIVSKISSHFGETKVTVSGNTCTERPDDLIERRFLADWYPAFNQYAIDEELCLETGPV
ncbi:hypothetical protein HDU98_004648 [Podochytrium sp. JEL0797]|nr:hypothetical protein HDU98_004648 [Podochytrium sp. JEL0797]